ncbi:hypothetical protein [Alistipes sp.]|uniref:hypothetical protein n=1 Tax=Alistipes sp. TaxID=1872444 RepID=UPI003A859FAF
MVAEVNKIIAGELLGHRAVTISGVGTLYVAHRGARRLSRRQIAAPRNEVEFRSSEDGVALAELIRRAAGCDAAQAQAIFERWLAKTRTGEVLTLEGIGTLHHHAFSADPAFAARLNPAGDDVVTLQPRMNRFVVAVAVVAVAVAVGVFGYIEFGPKSVARLIPRSERMQPRRSEVIEEKNVPAPVGEEAPTAAPISRDSVAEVAAPASVTAEDAAGADTVAIAGVRPADPAPPAGGAQPASERLQAGWCYVVLGVFSTEENAARCRDQLLRDMPSLAVGVYPFGPKYMVAPFAAQDRAACERFVREHRPAWPDLWIYAKR